MDVGGLGDVVLEVVLGGARNAGHGRDVDDGASVSGARGRAEEGDEGGGSEEVAVGGLARVT